MTILILIILGLAMGSFVNALLWRIEKQALKRPPKKIQGREVDLSIVSGRSVCVHCGHELASRDLVPVLSWVYLRGKCRYCKQRIPDSPVVELAMGVLFLVSYHYWPIELDAVGSWIGFGGWLLIVVGLVALFVYDLRHLLLPNRIVFPLMWIALARVVLLIAFGEVEFVDAFREVVLGVLVGGGFFYLLFQVSSGRWIGGGDVKLGFLIGIVAGPVGALVALLVAFYSASAFIMPLLVVGKVSRSSKIPFGPFLIIGLFISTLFSSEIEQLYRNLFGI